jgi:hypothetical protein
MAIFLGIFATLVVINVLLLVFSSTRRRPAVQSGKRKTAPASKSPIYPLKASDTKYQEAV